MKLFLHNSFHEYHDFHEEYPYRNMCGVVMWINVRQEKIAG